MTKGKIKWNIKGFEEIRRSAEVEEALEEAVEQVLDQVGEEHYAGNVQAGKTRSRGGVVTADFEGILENDQEQTLLRALGNVRV